MIKPRTTVWVLITLTIFLGIVFGYRAKFIASDGLNSFLSSLNPFSNLEERINDLERENLSLKTKILGQEIFSEDKIKVFSTYPFNNKSEIAINGGRDIGIEIGDVVVAEGNILVGRVKNVSNRTSIVTTIFDPTFEIPVRLDNSEIDALAVGGNILTINLIPKEINVEIGDLIVSAGMDLPYGLTLGEISSIEDSEKDVFKKASVIPGFEIKSLRDVSIYR